MSNAPALSNPDGYVAVNDVNFQKAGLIVTWRLRGSFDPAPFRAAWLAEGLAEGLLPSLPSEQKALGAAMKELSERRTLIRPLDKGTGWKVVGEHAKDDDLTYDTSGLTAKLDKVGRPTFSPASHPSAPRVKALYEEFLVRISRSEASSWLARDIMSEVDAVSVKDNGGVYYVPPHQVRLFERMVSIIERCTQHRVYPVPVVKAESTIAMVLDAMTEEVERECNSLMHEINNVGERAIASRVEKLNGLLAKTGRFEKLLGTKLTTARELMLDADGALSAAALAAMPQMKVGQ